MDHPDHVSPAQRRPADAPLLPWAFRQAMGFAFLNAGCAVEVLMLIGLVVINGLFAASEIALIYWRKARLMNWPPTATAPPPWR